MRLIRLFPLLILLSACQPQPPVSHEEEIAGIVHTLWIYDTDSKQAKRAVDAVFSELRLLSGYTEPRQSKPMARTNTMLRSREWFSVNPSMTGILKQSIDYYDKTGGTYNPAALGGLRQQWGFYSDTEASVPPKEKDVQAFLADLPTMKDIEFDGIRVRGRNPRIYLDFDYLGYGYAIDLQIAHLQQLGIHNARLRINQVERSIGRVPGIAYKSGQAHCHRSIATKPGSGQAAAIHDVISTRTGHPTEDAASIDVTANNASDASVACWALLVSEAESHRRLADQLGIIRATLVDANGNRIELNLHQTEPI